MEIIRIKRIALLTVAIISLSISAKAQTDTLLFKNGEKVIGELKRLDKGVVHIETTYSDSDFAIAWDQVAKISSTQYFLVTLSDGRRFNSRINSTKSIDEVELDNGESREVVSIISIVYFKHISQSFWDKISASIDVSLNLTKAKNLTQFNTRATAGYLADRWELKGNYNTVFSSQDSIENTKRMDANITFKYFLPNDFYVFYSNDFLQNDEQKLQLRSTSKLGLGYFLVHTNKAYWSTYVGLAGNQESYTENASPNRTSSEVFFGAEINLFNLSDLSLVSSAIGYSSLTETGRFRLDFKLDLKYDLPLDFYLKTGTTFNYDNRPVAGASELDYVIQTGIGWEW